METIKKFLEARKHLSPECKNHTCSFTQQMQGAFWTMIAFMFATFIFKIFVYLAIYAEFMTKYS